MRKHLPRFRAADSSFGKPIFLLALVTVFSFVIPSSETAAVIPDMPGGCLIPDRCPPAELFSTKAVNGKIYTMSAIDFSADMPPVINQAGVNSCQSWAVGYYAYGLLRRDQFGWDISQNDHLFSGMMLYWLCDRGRNEARSVGTAMTYLTDVGICTVSQWGGLFPSEYWRPARISDLIFAGHFKAADRSILFFNEAGDLAPFDNNIDLVKSALLERNPVVIGLKWAYVANPGNLEAPPYMYTYGSNTSDTAHALCLVGYDDNYAGVGAGAFKFINSLGEEFGSNGFGWISYELMEQGVNEAWVMADHAATLPELARGEYFYGPYEQDMAQIDPGEGNGIPLPEPAGGWEGITVEQSFSIDTSGWHPGMYVVGVRFQDIFGAWSYPRHIDVRVDEPAEAETQLVAAEIFVDADPGPGSGTPLALGEPSRLVNIVDGLSTTGIAPGLHTLSLRVQDNYGYWSVPRVVNFEMRTPGLINIVAAEWTTKSGSDPGTGLPAEPVDGEFDSPREDVQALNVVPDWSPGDDRIFVRVQDSTGRWAEDSLEDDEPPVAVCKNSTIFLGHEGSVQVTENDVDGGSTDNLLITNREVTPASFTCADLGPKTVLLTVYDLGGNMDTCEAVVTVSDTIEPVITACPPNRTLEANENCQSEIPDLSDALGVSDNCPDWSILQFPSAGTKVGLGNHPVTLAVSDSSGNEDSCITTIHVVDGQAPVITLNGDAMISVSCCGEYNDAGATATDNCDGSLTDAIVTGGDAVITSEPGTYIITYTVSDAAGKTAMISRTVVVRDDCPPFAGIPADKNMDWRITISEAISYLSGWQQGANPISLAIRAAFIWQNGEDYTINCALTEPLCWEPGEQGGPCTRCE